MPGYMGVKSSENRKRRILPGQQGNTLMALIAINAIAFVAINFIKITYFLSGAEMQAFYHNTLNWVVVPGSLQKLITRPFTILTYMFAHEGVWHMISNMLWLWAFGYILQDLTGNRHMAPVYLYAGVIGAVMFLVTVNLFPILRQSAETLAPLQGAGAAIMGVAVATTVIAPNYRIFPMLNGGIPLWVLTMVFVLVDFAMISSAGAGAGVAHLSGGLVGFMYVRSLQKSNDWGLWMHQLYDWFFNLFNPAKTTRIQPPPREKVYYKADRTPYVSTGSISQHRVDELLDKIGQRGINSLTDDERDYLQRASREEQ